MVRQLKPAIPPKVYRHFALFTVALTAGIAMFANGENREAVAERIDEHQEQQKLQQISREQVGPPRVGQRPTRRRSGFSSDSEISGQKFGQPMERPTNNSGGAERAAIDNGAATQAGYSEAYLASLGEEDRKMLLEGLAQAGMLSSADRERKSDSLIAASHRRSGGAATAE